jgi:hypothetical protein
MNRILCHCEDVDDIVYNLQSIVLGFPAEFKIGGLTVVVCIRLKTRELAFRAKNLVFGVCWPLGQLCALHSMDLWLGPDCTNTENF